MLQGFKTLAEEQSEGEDASKAPIRHASIMHVMINSDMTIYIRTRYFSFWFQFQSPYSSYRLAQDPSGLMAYTCHFLLF